MIESLAKMLKGDDNHSRGTTIELCKKLTYRTLLHLYFLPLLFIVLPIILTVVIEDIVVAIFNSDVIDSLLKKLGGGSEDMKCMTLELFTVFTQYGASLSGAYFLPVNRRCR